MSPFEDDRTDGNGAGRGPKQSGYDAIVVFVGHTECYWLRWLRPGFRHCFSAIKSDGCWIICDPLKDRMTLIAVDLAHDFDLAAFYAAKGYVVLAGRKARQESVSFLHVEFLTCVTVTKRLLGLRSFWVWTPWQLFRFLAKQQANNGFWHHIYLGPREEANFQLDI